MKNNFVIWTDLEVAAVVALVDPDAAVGVGVGVGERAQSAPVRPEDADVGVREAAIAREADCEPIWNWSNKSLRGKLLL